MADSPVEVARSTLREVASHAGGLRVTRPVRSELAIANGGLHGLCMHATLKRAPYHVIITFKRTLFRE